MGMHAFYLCATGTIHNYKAGTLQFIVKCCKIQLQFQTELNHSTCTLLFSFVRFPGYIKIFVKDLCVSTKNYADVYSSACQLIVSWLNSSILG